MECILLHNTFPSAKVSLFYIFTLLMFRKLNTTTTNKNKTIKRINCRFLKIIHCSNNSVTPEKCIINSSRGVALIICIYHILSTKQRKFPYIILKEHYDCICLPWIISISYPYLGVTIQITETISIW